MSRHKGTATILLSGGMDSATLAYYLADFGYDLRGLSVFYGQRHRRELEASAALMERLGQTHHVVELSGLVLPGNALTDNVAVPHGHYAEDSMKATVVPNRNAIFLTLAYALASAHQDAAVATAVHAGDHYIYPDCRPEFTGAFATMERRALSGLHCPELLVPFLSFTKTDIARVGGGLGVPYELTWTCYEGGAVHCGLCGACQERQEAFRDSGVNDPTTYA